MDILKMNVYLVQKLSNMAAYGIYRLLKQNKTKGWMTCRPATGQGTCTRERCTLLVCSMRPDKERCLLLSKVQARSSQVALKPADSKITILEEFLLTYRFFLTVIAMPMIMLEPWSYRLFLTEWIIQCYLLQIYPAVQPRIAPIPVTFK